MSTTAERLRSYDGPAILSHGFRPFFLGGSIWAVCAIVIWIPVFNGSVILPTSLTPVQWHVHALLFGYVPAIVAGFLLTAVPNWTGRLPVTGTPLFLLFATWVLGRLAVLQSALIGAWPAALLSCAFLFTLIVIIARELAAGGNARNYKILAIVALLLAANAVFHIEAILETDTLYGQRFGLAAILLLIALIGGRVIPSFTRNWLAQRNHPNLPVAFNAFDKIVVIATAVALASWSLAPEHVISGWTCTIAAILHILRLLRWQGHCTVGEPLVLILHVAYLFLPVGFALVAWSIFAPEVLLPSGALHAWTTGTIGLMTLAIMTRASLGHSGRPVKATLAIEAIYGLAFAAVLTRLLAAFDFLPTAMLTTSAMFWALAFGAFAIAYWPMLTRPRAG